MGKVEGGVEWDDAELQRDTCTLDGFSCTGMRGHGHREGHGWGKRPKHEESIKQVEWTEAQGPAGSSDQECT